MCAGSHKCDQEDKSVVPARQAVSFWFDLQNLQGVHYSVICRVFCTLIRYSLKITLLSQNMPTLKKKKIGIQYSYNVHYSLSVWLLFITLPGHNFAKLFYYT